MTDKFQEFELWECMDDNITEKVYIKDDRDKTIKITVFQGVVNSVENLPLGWDYKVDDQD